MRLLSKICCLMMVVAGISSGADAQPGTSIEVEKPEKYQSKTLPAERTQDKKFGVGKRVYQNTVTHYNYYFNANAKLENVLFQAGQAAPGDYGQLLPFYAVSPTQTQAFKTELDSVILKATTGVVLHDLRTNWVDNLYLLMGQAYYYRGDLDSALWVFQYINYAFAEKDDGYDIPIGSNVSNSDGIFTVVSPEKDSKLRRLISRPPSRNNALLWMTRTLLEMNNTAAAGGLIQILRKDPKFPKRLNSDLDEVTAYYHYKTGRYDSAGYYLTEALDNAENLQQRSRWEFLTAQLYQRAGNSQEASAWYAKAAAHTLDPVMEVNATLNAIRLGNGGKEKGDFAQERIDGLARLARRDKYEQHRDLIYLTIARAEMDRGKKQAAVDALYKSLRYPSDPAMKAQAFLLLGETAFDAGAYGDAARFYDSIDVSQLTDSTLIAGVNSRKPALKEIAAAVREMQVQDSVQKLALLPEKERNEAVRKAYRLARKQAGEKEAEEDNRSYGSTNPAIQPVIVTDLFTSSKGDFYFNNNSAKAQGFQEFRQRWGDRPNVDNWRRQAAVAQQVGSSNTDAVVDVLDVPQVVDANGKIIPGLKKQSAPGEGEAAAPLSLDGMMAALPTTPEKLSASNAKVSAALLGIGKAFQYQLNLPQDARQRYYELFDRYPKADEVPEALYHLHVLGASTGNKALADSAAAVLRKQMAGSEFAKKLDAPPPGQEKSMRQAGTQAYARIYDLFLSGNYAEAQAAKKTADSLYGKYYWTPQLLFIEAVYHMSVRNDSVALSALRSLTNQFPTSPLTPRAMVMMDVLGRRAEIEQYLTQLDVKRYEDTAVLAVTEIQRPTDRVPQVQRMDTVAAKPVIPTVAPTVIAKDTIAVTPDVIRSYQFSLADPHYAVLMLNQVDGVFANEARNAINRYNSSTGNKITVAPAKVNDKTSFVLVGPFPNVVEATAYVEKTKPQMATRITPWLAADKYSFTIISQPNLTLLQELKDVDQYQQFLRQAQPGKW